MGRLRAWHNLPPVLQCSKYRRLLENSSTNSLQQLNGATNDDDVAADCSGGLSDSCSDIREKKCKRSKVSGSGKPSKKKDNTRQLIQESFQELMSYSCGQCGHVQTLQAEELKSILGHAFRLAYAAHLQKAAGIHDYPGASPPPPPSPPPVVSCHRTATTTTATSASSRRHLTSQSLHSLHSSTHQHLLHQSSSPSSLKDTIHAGYSSSTNNSDNSSSASIDKQSVGRLHPHPHSHTHTHTDQRPCDQTCLGTSEISNTNSGGNSSSSSGVSSIVGGGVSSGGGSRRAKMRSPACLPGLQQQQQNCDIDLHHRLQSNDSSNLSPHSDTSNSPTDHNSSHRLLDKPPLLKNFSVPPLEDAPLPPTSSPTHHLVEPCSSSNNNNNNLTNNLNTGGSTTVGGYVNEGNKHNNAAPIDCCSTSTVLVHNIALSESDNILSNTQSTSNSIALINASTHSPLHSFHSIHLQSPLHSTHSQSSNHSSHSTHSQSPFHSSHSQSPHHSTHSQSPLHSSQSPLHSTHSQSPIQSTLSPVHLSQSPHHSTQSSVVSSQSSNHCPSPPPLPERSDSLTVPDEPHLRAAAWFQAGIPREIALEVLGQEPLGAFLVRESSSKPGCYALSLRVPTDFATAGIAHYLIVRTNRGYRIKGFTKEFPTLRTLITHHSVMPELLPVPLLLTRHNPAYQPQQDPAKDQNEEDPDYNTLSDFRKMMAELNV
uniref:Ras guanine nucleotide exchange factor Y-like n=1 Tax=Hirondellea gigas TaxID=1518452 RepID=A0A2P2HZR7_9CRUS